MFSNQMEFVAERKLGGIDNRIFGLLGVIGAPMLFLFFLFSSPESNQNGAETNPLVAMLGVFYIGGWICSAIGMYRAKVYGESFSAKIVFAVQMTLLAFAFMFSVLETSGVNYTNGGIIFGICDAAYPLSHLFMIVVGFFTIRAKKWTGILKFAPLIVGFALPLTLGLMPLLGEKAGIISFGILTTIGLGVIGYKIMGKP